MGEPLDKYYLTGKMLAYILGFDGSADGGGWLIKATINPSIAHSILSYNTNGHRAGVDNYVCKEMPLDTPVTEIRKHFMEEPKVIRLGYYMESGYDGSSVMDINGIIPTFKDNHNTVMGILEEPNTDCEKKVGNLYGATGGNYAGNVYDDNYLAPSIRTCGGGNQQPMVIDEQKTYRIRKLTPRECWRLMSFTDEEFDKAAKVNSNTQLYKQAGNSIVVDVLAALFQEIINADGTVNDHKGEQINLFDIL